MTGQFTLADGRVILLRRSARARRMILRVPQGGGDAVLTLPAHAALSDGRAFAQSRADWLARAAARVPVAQTVAPGAVFPVQGRDLVLTPAGVRSARIDGEALLVPQSRATGPVVQAFLKHLAHQRLRERSDAHAAALGRSYCAIALRDTKSRWGSCSHDGRLMYSWRLAMAPPEVLDYVAAHEVAHLAHMDHSPRFWAAVGALVPDWRPRRDWLRQNGGALMLWRFTTEPS